MPRTKISKNVKRNRDAAKHEEKIREYENEVEKFITALETQAQSDIEELHSKMIMIKDRIPKQILQMTMADFRKLNITKFSEYAEKKNNHYDSLQRSVKKSRDDEEDSGKGTSRESALSTYTGRFAIQPPNRGRTPGPFSSAKAQQRQRRSKSACSEFIQPTPAKKLPVVLDHVPRNKMRTPNCTRSKATSADRYSRLRESQGSPTALLRWPKPGEKVISMQGSPLVAQTMPGSYCANVNIPVKNGVLSLRPKKLASLNPEVIENIDPETIDQIKTLQSNLNIIMSYAEKVIGGGGSSNNS